MYEYETNYWWYVGLHELILFFVNKKSGGEQLSIIDAGCGTGRLLELLSEHQTKGFDFSDEAIEFCKKRELKNVFKQDINKWSPTEKYNVIISADVICSIGIDDYKLILKNFYEGLEKDGILILNLPAFEILRRNHDKAVFVGKRFRLNELKKALIDGGFKINFISYRLPFLFFVILIEKFFQKIFIKNNVESDLKPIPNFLNSILLFYTRIENYFFRFLRNPFLGSSVFVVAKKI